MIRRPNDIRGLSGPKASWHYSYRWGIAPKNLTQETCLDQGSNQGPLRDRRACYHLSHSVRCNVVILVLVYISSSVFCPKAAPSLQAEKLRLQFCRRQVFHRKLRNQGCILTRDLIGAVASRCFQHTTLSLASEQILKDLKRSHGHQWGGEESGFG